MHWSRPSPKASSLCDRSGAFSILESLIVLGVLTIMTLMIAALLLREPDSRGTSTGAPQSEIPTAKATATPPSSP